MNMIRVKDMIDEKQDIISNVNEIDKKKMEYCSQNHIFYSQLFLDSLLGEYNRSYFREMLKDWKHES